MSAGSFPLPAFDRLPSGRHDRMREPGEARKRLAELPGEVFELNTGEMDELVREFLRTRDPRELRGLTEPAIAATLALLGDREAARELDLRRPKLFAE
jgi:hypothetical protein